MSRVEESACDACLRRAFLVGRLAPRIAGLLDRPGRRTSGLLALSESDLLAAVAGERAEQIALDLEQLRAGRGARAACASPGPGALPSRRPSIQVGCATSTTRPRPCSRRGAMRPLELLCSEPAVAIVGTRDPSPYGTEVARSLGRGLGAAGVPVVSGLALGIDATAHRGCLEGGGAAFAVLACGPDVAYPRRHRRLHEHIRENGLVVSELPPGTPPFRWSFPARNRIMAALSRLTVVVEAADPSGSLITTDFARDLGRSVAAVPGQGDLQGCPRYQWPLEGRRRADHQHRGRARRALRRGSQIPARGVPQRAEPEDPVLRHVLEAAERMDSVASIAKAVGLSTAETRAALARLEGDGYLVRRSLDGWERALGPILRGPVSRSRVAATQGALHRRLGLRRRGGHSGGPQGVRPLRRPRHDGDHRRHRAEHRGGHRRSIRCPPRRSSSRSARWSRTSASTRSRSACSAPRRRSTRWTAHSISSATLPSCSTP